MMNEWQKVKLEDIAEITGGGTPSKSNEEYWNGDIPWLTPTDVTKNNRRYLTYTENYITDKGLRKSAAKLIPENNVLMTSRATIGKSIINTVPMTTNQGFANFVCNKEKVAPEYLLYFLNSKGKVFEQLGSGSTFKEISKGELKSFIIDLPPLKEQQKIASILSSVDEAIEKTEAIIEQTEQVKKGLMQQLLTKGIGHTEFKDTSIGEIPKDWKVKSFNDLLNEGVISLIQDGNHGSIHPKSSDYVMEGIPFIMANDLSFGEIDIDNCTFIKKEQADKLRKGFSYTGDVLLSHKGTIGQVAIVPYIEDFVMLTPQVTLYRVSNEKVLLKEYLSLYFQSERFQSELKKISAQSTRNYVGITKQKTLTIPIPDKIEQEKLVNVFNSIDEKLSKEEWKLEVLDKLKQGLMQQLLTGKVRVPLDVDEEVTT